MDQEPVGIDRIEGEALTEADIAVLLHGSPIGAFPGQHDYEDLFARMRAAATKLSAAL